MKLWAKIIKIFFYTLIILCLNKQIKRCVTCIENIKQHQAKYSSNTNLYGQLENCLKELNLPGEPNYSEYFDAVDKKAGTNWRQIFKEIA